MLTGIFPDICASINRIECLLCINLSTGIRHYKIIGRKHGSIITVPPLNNNK